MHAPLAFSSFAFRRVSGGVWVQFAEPRTRRHPPQLRRQLHELQEQVPTSQCGTFSLQPSVCGVYVCVCALAVEPVDMHSHADHCINLQITYTQRSTLVLEGPSVTVESLDLDGTLIVKAVPGAKVGTLAAHVPTSSCCVFAWGCLKTHVCTAAVYCICPRASPPLLCCFEILVHSVLTPPLFICTAQSSSACGSGTLAGLWSPLLLTMLSLMPSRSADSNWSNTSSASLSLLCLASMKWMSSNVLEASGELQEDEYCASRASDRGRTDGHSHHASHKTSNTRYRVVTIVY